MSKTPEVIQAELREFFAADVIGWKPQSTSGNRALAVAYIDARDVENRLDDVMGVWAWKDEYRVLDEGNVVCTLSLKIDDEWIGKTDVGGESDQKDLGDKRKAAFSDAFKRAGVKWGIGRYLYSMPTQWLDFDPQKKTFTRDPVVPDRFLPKPPPARPAQPKTQGQAPRENGKPKEELPPAPPGGDFQRKLYEYDSKLASAGVIAAGELVKDVQRAGAAAGYPDGLAQWDERAQQFASATTADFLAGIKETIIRHVHAQLLGKQLTWTQYLAQRGITLAQSFMEPANVGQAIAVFRELLKVEQLQQLADSFKPQKVAS